MQLMHTIQTWIHSFVSMGRGGHLHKHAVLVFLATTGILVVILFGLWTPDLVPLAQQNRLHASDQASGFGLPTSAEMSDLKSEAESPKPEARSLSQRLFFNNWKGIGVIPFCVICVLFALVALLTKLCMDVYCRWAIKAGLVAHPDANRRLQKTTIPLGGGIVVFGVTLIVLVGLGALSDESVSISALASSKILFPLLTAAAVLVCVGMADDKWELKGRTKLLSQIVVATMVIAFAGDFTTISIFGTQIDLGHLFYPLGILWLVGMINAVNFLDGADGVAATAGIFMVLTVSVFAVITGQTTVFLISVVFAGALLGFLLCNFPPAKVYLGDAGSTLIGLVTGVLLIRSCTVENHVIHILPPLAVAIIPILDACFSFYRRMSSGRGLFAPDRAHIHHRLLVRFQCNRKILRVFSLFFLSGGVVAGLGMHDRNDWFPLAVVIMTPCVLIVTGWFGREETLTFLERLRHQWKKRILRKKDRNIGVMYRYQGDGPWDELWEDLTSTLSGVSCHKASLDINIPFLHESWIGRLDNPDVWFHHQSVAGHNAPFDILISYAIPLLYGRQKVGMLEISLCGNDLFPHDATHGIADNISELCVKYITDFIRSKNHLETIPSVFAPAAPQSQFLAGSQVTPDLKMELDRTREDRDIFETSIK